MGNSVKFATMEKLIIPTFIAVLGISVVVLITVEAMLLSIIVPAMRHYFGF